MLKRITLMSIGSGIILFSIYTFAATSTTTFNVTASVASACIISASTLGFGNYNPTLGAALNGSSTVTVTCTTGTTYNVGLDQGTGTGATVTTRFMTRVSGGTQVIAYSLYQNNARTTVWGNTIGTNTVTGTGTGVAQPLTVFGQIFASNPTTLPVASYLDTITATVTY